jgi:murein DD-endopeptidase MepM/ murein hydrolase activator NlpD
VTSLDARPHSESQARRRGGGKNIPFVFIIGVVMMSAVAGAMVVKGAAAGGTTAAASSTTASPRTPDPTYTSGSSQYATPALSTVPVTAPSASGSRGGLSGYVWPLANPRLTLPFGPSPWGEFFVDGVRFHDGVDLASNCGDRVLAAHDGVVLAAGRKYDDYMGWTGSLAPYYALLDRHNWWSSLPIVVIIDDGNGYRSIYAHESRVSVKVGQRLRAGQLIGFEGSTGNASGCHVHFGLFRVAGTATYELDPAVVAKDSMPQFEIARTDPLTVLPFRCDVPEMTSRQPDAASSCRPAAGTQRPSPTASSGPTNGVEFP